MQRTFSPQADGLLFRDASGRYCARLSGYRFYSVFQPLFYRGGGLFGYEALLRVVDDDGEWYAPDRFLASLPPQQALEADRLARLIHVRNFAQSRQDHCLTLNLLSHTVLGDHGGRTHLPLLQGLLQSLEIDSGGVIFELPEYEVEQHGQPLLDGLRHASDIGFGVAVDDFGALDSRHGRVGELCPDIIKIDRSLLLDYMAGERQRLPALLEFGWQIGSRMLVEGIESAEQHQAMQALGVELYQGYHLGRPTELPVACQL
ncbi:EAL domain-containing protein [Chromobacterium sphagni]|uniref:EAL domain-containing protein n=1 Tax=Chromobacterium sphagni TaxID=1903179 RepID=A0A1S1X5U2_9NEIS|nr:EAL domain-containing protein [Chromobacterium sphagni]OHX14829.1 EAL domain-containing protein [Chromobacterium sphagni]OHX22121.1 EAL domain-containing protein [Chromobacterium sphagni]